MIYITFLLLLLFLLITILFHQDFSHGKFLLSPSKASCDRVALPNLLNILGDLCFHNPPNSDKDYRIFNVSTDFNACDCTRGTDTVRESARKVDSGRKTPYRTVGSNLRQRRAGPSLYRLGYIPTLTRRKIRKFEDQHTATRPSKRASKQTKEEGEEKVTSLLKKVNHNDPPPPLPCSILDREKF